MAALAAAPLVVYIAQRQAAVQAGNVESMGRSELTDSGSSADQNPALLAAMGFPSPATGSPAAEQHASTHVESCFTCNACAGYQPSKALCRAKATLSIEITQLTEQQA